MVAANSDNDIGQALRRLVIVVDLRDVDRGSIEHRRVAERAARATAVSTLVAEPRGLVKQVGMAGATCDALLRVHHALLQCEDELMCGTGGARLREDHVATILRESVSPPGWSFETRPECLRSIAGTPA